MLDKFRELIKRISYALQSHTYCAIAVKAQLVLVIETVAVSIVSIVHRKVNELALHFDIVLNQLHLHIRNGTHR